MQLNKLIVETRVRSGWASIDLGFVLGRQFWLRSVCLYLALALPIYALARLTSGLHYALPFFIVWWCKPMFERPILFMLSRELFSQKMGFMQTFREYKQWLYPGLGSILTLRRLSIGRAMYAPITLLERPLGAQYNKRAGVLGNKFSSEASWLTVTMFHLEQFIALSIFALLVFLLPEQFDVSLAWLSSLNTENIYFYISALIVVAVVAPFYVAAGFMLYISRRVELEGWDIEICFRDWMTGYKAPPVRKQPVALDTHSQPGAQNA